MRPKLKPNYVPDLSKIHSILCCKSPITYAMRVLSPNLQHCGIGQLRVPVPFASGSVRYKWIIRSYVPPAMPIASPASLLFFVGVVIGPGAQEEVIGSHAGGVVAGMANTQSRGNRPIVEYPGNPLCSIALAAIAESPVPFVCFATNPKPAGRRLVDEPKKSNYGVLKGSHASYYNVSPSTPQGGK